MLWLSKHEYLRRILCNLLGKWVENVARLNAVPVINVFCESGFGYARVKNKDYQ